MRDDSDTDRLIYHLTAAMELSQSLRQRCVHRLLAMALIDLGQDIAAEELRDAQISDDVAC